MHFENPCNDINLLCKLIISVTKIYFNHIAKWKKISEVHVLGLPGPVFRKMALCLREPWRDMGIFKKSHKYIVISNCAIRSHGLVIRSIELDNPFSRVASRSLELHISIRENRLSNSRELIAIRDNELSN